jgi:hypothetical protein
MDISDNVPPALATSRLPFFLSVPSGMLNKEIFQGRDLFRFWFMDFFGIEASVIIHRMFPVVSVVSLASVGRNANTASGVKKEWIYFCVLGATPRCKTNPN